MVRASPEKMAALTKMGFDEYSNLVEFLGFSHSHVHPDNRPPPESEISFSDEVLRNVIVRLLASSEQTSSVWRDPLSHALRAANAGEVHPLFDPGKKRRRGRPYVLNSARAVAVAHVYYLVGKGFKRHPSLLTARPRRSRLVVKLSEVGKNLWPRTGGLAICGRVPILRANQRWKATSILLRKNSGSLNTITNQRACLITQCASSSGSMTLGAWKLCKRR